MSVKIGNLHMKNPVTTASGTYGQGDIFEPFYDINILGALTTKSVTPAPRSGNPPPRIAETPSGILNSIGLQNPGFDSFCKKYSSYFNSLRCPLIVSISGNTVEEYADIAYRVSDHLPAKALEINISCPNIKEGGVQFSSSPESASSVIRAVRARTTLVIITKLSPQGDNHVEIAKACVEEGTDAISAINTLKGLALDIETRKPVLGNITGGLSGPAIKPVALRIVYELAQNISVPIIGMGGISSASDALEFIIAGASAVAVGTANFFNPGAIPEIIDGIRSWMISHDVNSLNQIRKTVK